MKNYVGLYYPFMEFNDDNWVKLAALYWERLGRIVPKGYRPSHDSDTVKLLADELGFVENASPSSRDEVIVSRMFIEVLTKHEQKLVEMYGIKLGSSTAVKPKAPLSADETRKIEEELYEEYLQENVQELLKYEEMPQLLVQMLRPKFDPKLVSVFEAKQLIKKIKNHANDPMAQNRILEQSKLGHVDSARSKAQKQAESYLQASLSEIDYDGHLLYAPLSWESEKRILVHPKLAFIYVEALADVMASDRKFDLVTSDLLSHVATSGYTVERLTQALLSDERSQPLLAPLQPQTGEIEQHLAAVALRSVIPRNLSDIPTKKIVEIRKKYRDEMIAFQNAIHALSEDRKDINDINDFEAFKMQIEIIYERELKPELNNFKKILNSLGIDTITSAMNIQVALPPLLASTLTAGGAYFHLSPLNPIVLGGGAIACSVFPVIRKMQEEGKQKVCSSPMSYLFYVQEQLEPTNIVKSISRQARKMLFRI
jgi:Family of unknown function (DUF6236)